MLNVGIEITMHKKKRKVESIDIISKVKSPFNIPNFKPFFCFLIFLNYLLFIPSAFAESDQKTNLATNAKTNSKTNSEAKLQKITAVVVKNFPPHYSIGENNQPIGFAIDVMNEIAAKANIDISYVVQDNWILTAKYLKQGNADLIPNLGISPLRLKDFDFSLSVETFPISIIVRSESNEIKDVTDLSHHTIGVVAFNVGAKIVSKLENISPVVFDEPEDALISLLSGNIDALVYPKSVMLRIARQSGLEKRIKIIKKPVKEIKRAIAVKKGNEKLLKKLNYSIKTVISSKEYEEIYKKWYGTPQTFWTVFNVALISGFIIILTITISGIWRFNTITKMNKNLLTTIEERKKVEKSLQETNLLLENVMSTTPDLIFVKNEKLQTILCSDSYAAALGKSPKEMYGLTDIENGWDPELVKGNPEKNIRGFESDDKAVLMGNAIHNPYDPANVDGQILIFDTHKVPLLDTSGNVIGVLGIARDVTERNNAQQSLEEKTKALAVLNLELNVSNKKLLSAIKKSEESESSFNKLFNLTRDGYVINKGSGELIRPNPAYLKMTGYNEDEISKISWRDITPKKWLDWELETHGKQLMERGFTDLYEKEYIHKDGTVFPVQVQAYLLNQPEKIEGSLIAVFVRDISDVKNVEKNAEILKSQLQQAQKMEAIGQLTGGIAHDFNNILASVLGFTNLALQRYVRDDQVELRDYLNEVSQAGERARDLVKQMLSFSRTGEGKAVRLELPPMIKEVSKLMHATIPSGIHLSTYWENNLPAVMIDPVQLQQILMNLCINARDEIGETGRIDIEARLINSENNLISQKNCSACHQIIETKDYIEVSVKDTGMGISAEQMKHIFEPFFTTKDVDKGTGMGLSMVHGIIHQFGGHILVDSVVGLGTTFRLFLPVVGNAPTYDSTIALVSDPVTEEIKGSRILIIDDEQSVARFISDLLESRGCKTTVMLDSQTALALFTQDPEAFDLIITDQTMPEISGVDLSQSVLNIKPGFPIILCTGYSEKINADQAQELGISGYLSKPMQVNALLSLVVKLLKT